MYCVAIVVSFMYIVSSDLQAEGILRIFWRAPSSKEKQKRKTPSLQGRCVLKLDRRYPIPTDPQPSPAVCRLIIGAARPLDLLSQLTDSDNITITSSCCASCGIAEVDDMKLSECTACDIVRYCSDECKQDHKSQHKGACKKRAAELRDELLFKQPESSHLGDCPICYLPLPLDLSKSIIISCCSKTICQGCSHANELRLEEERLEYRCEFCREPTPSTDEQCDKQRMKRIEANDPVALRYQGREQYEKGDYSSAFGYYTRAAGLGDVEAQFQLAHSYQEGHGVEKDRGKEIHHLEEAAIGGHPIARFNLGWNEWNNGNTEKAVKHFIIAVTQGDDESIKNLMFAFKEGYASKDDLAAALRAHQAAVDATKSPQRDAAEAFYRNKDSINS
eukprot:scaffold12168_cov74-Skeletonema_dohrnii-CCMP3373.AAC.2